MRREEPERLKVSMVEGRCHRCKKLRSLAEATSPLCTPCVRGVLEENERLRAQLLAALALHKHQEHAGLPEGECAECGFPWEDGYCPSPTVKALRGGSDAD